MNMLSYNALIVADHISAILACIDFSLGDIYRANRYTYQDKHALCNETALHSCNLSKSGEMYALRVL